MFSTELRQPAMNAAHASSSDDDDEGAVSQVGEHHRAPQVYSPSAPNDRVHLDGIDQQKLSTPPRHALMDRPFVFQRRRERVNWRALSSLSLDQVVATVDVDVLQEHLSNITFCDLTEEKFDNVDPDFAKLFQLAQLMLEYVLFVQEQLIVGKEYSDGHLRKCTEELHRLRVRYASVKRDNKRCSQTVIAYQKMCDIHGIRWHAMWSLPRCSLSYAHPCMCTVRLVVLRCVHRMVSLTPTTQEWPGTL
eukprot:m.311605 g.311605  ORF g.311605 m.311605 type:complete len:248 (+) comp20228_c0_seq2:187-930(+)